MRRTVIVLTLQRDACPSCYDMLTLRCPVHRRGAVRRADFALQWRAGL
jgi:hypothetical protein